MGNKENQGGNEREPFKINFTERPALDFVGNIAYLSSTELGKIIYSVFKNVYQDFEGCIFKPGNGEANYSLIFNHGNYADDAIVGVTRNTDNSTTNDTINRLRAHDRSLRYGDKYFPTNELKDIVGKLLTNRAYNNGKPNWGQIINEYTDQTMSNMYMAQNQKPQLTEVKFIDLNRIVKYIFGGDDVEYIVGVAAPISPMGFAFNQQQIRNYMLTITAVNAENIQKVYEKLGFGSMMSNIIR